MATEGGEIFTPEDAENEIEMQKRSARTWNGNLHPGKVLR